MYEQLHSEFPVALLYYFYPCDFKQSMNKHVKSKSLFYALFF